MKRTDDRPGAPSPRRRRWEAFLDGMASIVNLYGLPPRRKTRMSDAEAFEHDWNQVGKDLWIAFAEVAHQDDDLRRRLAEDARERYEQLVKWLPLVEKEDPRAAEAVRSAADRLKWFRTVLRAERQPGETAAGRTPLPAFPEWVTLSSPRFRGAEEGPGSPPDSPGPQASVSEVAALPAPETLARYRETDPRFVDAILDAYVRGQAHRREREREGSGAARGFLRRGSALGAMVAISAVLVAGAVGIYGSAWAAVAIVIVGVGAPIVAAIHGDGKQPRGDPAS